MLRWAPEDSLSPMRKARMLPRPMVEQLESLPLERTREGPSPASLMPHALLLLLCLIRQPITTISLVRLPQTSTSIYCLRGECHVQHPPSLSTQVTSGRPSGLLQDSFV